MATFVLDSFCRKIPDDILRQALTKYDVNDANLAALRSADKCTDEWERLRADHPELKKLQVVFHEINGFREEAGETALQASIFGPRPDWLPIDRVAGIQGVMLSVFIHDPYIYQRACTRYLIDSTRAKGWKQYSGIWKQTVNSSEAARSLLAEDIRKILARQMRGRYCRVAAYDSTNQNSILVATFSDFLESSEEWTTDGDIQQYARRPVRRLAFIYNPEAGTLRVNVEGFGKVGLTLHDAFCRDILGMPGLPKEAPQSNFHIRQLLQATPPNFVLDPTGPIQSFVLSELKFSDPRNPSTKINIVAPKNKDGMADLYRQLALLFKGREGFLRLFSAVFYMKYQLPGRPPRTRRIRLEEGPMQRIDSDPSDEALHELLIENGLEEPPQDAEAEYAEETN
ncbi:hypothetical protein MAF45_07835 [Mesosutterella sp. OilRF-GAM-744-9]|uniref:Uncharacterized protein n=1 Tax=Mesosutterella porci TaxID=2915351 RepID=A0ABS9MRU2_9BURK|nr:hypothetical protein [Mesosutterella sp. oilRF-744-WT-GAM-9]MCG5031348.1 hypothetical protein [Mesosutterella sp. oilRF-744-WT-GAM-9]